MHTFSILSTANDSGILLTKMRKKNSKYRNIYIVFSPTGEIAWLTTTSCAPSTRISQCHSGVFKWVFQMHYYRYNFFRFRYGDAHCSLNYALWSLEHINTKVKKGRRITMFIIVIFLIVYAKRSVIPPEQSNKSLIVQIIQIT